jgi:cobalt-zinc-cadmium efflux system membrane fusion protein
MRVVSLHSGVLLAVAALAGLALSGCADRSTPDTAAPAEDVQPTGAVDDHSGWWCPEHGVPEEVCTRCDTSLAAEYQQKGDWCEEHNRPESQCFICQPDLEANFAAQYEAKFGKKPPKPGA